MKLKALFEDDGAVSPVIGVILMVAITVILAAVIGTFVLGLGDRVSQASPNAQFSFEYGEHGTDNAVNITHDGGDAVETDQLDVSIGGTTAFSSGEIPSTVISDFQIVDSKKWDGKITADSELSLAEDGSSSIENDDSVKVIWNAPGSDKTAVIGESEVSL